MEDDFVTISKKELEYLRDREWFLVCLEGAGVDNWSGYDDAVIMYEEGSLE